MEIILSYYNLYNSDIATSIIIFVILHGIFGMGSGIWTNLTKSKGNILTFLKGYSYSVLYDVPTFNTYDSVSEERKFKTLVELDRAYFSSTKTKAAKNIIRGIIESEHNYQVLYLYKCLQGVQ